MAVYNINNKDNKVSELNQYKIKYEGRGEISPQAIIAATPEIILSVPELEMSDFETSIVVREFNTRRGGIDLLIITENAEIILIETKLYKNPESHRTVVAQAIDYTKALIKYDLEYFQSQFAKSKNTNRKIVDKLFSDDRFQSTLNQNIKTGNIKVVIVGDTIHPNILEMVDALQSAPHLGFSLFLVELNPYESSDGNILLYPRILSKTNEVERSVIKVEIDFKEKKYEIDSTVPDKQGKGSRPILTAEHYLQTVSKVEFRRIIKEFWEKWKDVGGDIRFGVKGFSCGIGYKNKRIPIQFIYDNHIALIFERPKSNYNIPEKAFNSYLELLKTDLPLAYDYYVSGKQILKFEILSDSDIKVLLKAALQFGRDLQK